jgi:6-phosphogluconolactonase
MIKQARNRYLIMKPLKIILFNPEKIANQLVDFAGFCVSKNGYFRLVLAGGNTPKQIYEILEQKQPDSTTWELFFGDERDLPINHPDRNSTMVEKAMPQLIKKSHYYPILNAKDYDNLIKSIPTQEHGNEKRGAHENEKNGKKNERKSLFDLVLLGVGEDGHTASIFPNKTYSYLNYLQIIEDAPKPPPSRISLNVKALNDTQQTWVFATGESKKDVLNQWFNGKKLPIADIEPIDKFILFSDKTALPNQRF